MFPDVCSSQFGKFLKSLLPEQLELVIEASTHIRQLGQPIHLTQSQNSAVELFTELLVIPSWLLSVNIPRHFSINRFNLQTIYFNCTLKLSALRNNGVSKIRRLNQIKKTRKSTWSEEALFIGRRRKCLRHSSITSISAICHFIRWIFWICEEI